MERITEKQLLAQGYYPVAYEIAKHLEDTFETADICAKNGKCWFRYSSISEMKKDICVDDKIFIKAK